MRYRITAYERRLTRRTMMECRSCGNSSPRALRILTFTRSSQVQYLVLSHTKLGEEEDEDARRRRTKIVERRLRRRRRCPYATAETMTALHISTTNNTKHHLLLFFSSDTTPPPPTATPRCVPDDAAEDTSEYRTRHQANGTPTAYEQHLVLPSRICIRLKSNDASFVSPSSDKSCWFMWLWW